MDMDKEAAHPHVIQLTSPSLLQCQAYDVKGYPTIKFFKDGALGPEFSRQRTVGCTFCLESLETIL